MADSAQKTSRNPGSFEQLHQKAQDIFPLAFEGAKIAIQKGISSHFQVSHTLSISPANTGYKFGATYVGTQTGEGPQEVFPVILGDTDVSGNTTATIVHQIGKYRGKLQAQVAKGEIQGAQGSVERRGDLCTLAMTLANTNILNDSGVFVTSYLRKITERLDIGLEYMNSYGPQVPGGSFSLVSYGGRYATSVFTGAVTMSRIATHLSYFHKQTPNLAFGIEFNMNHMQQDAITTFAYQTEIPEEGVTFRASVDTNWTVAGVLEKRLSQTLPFTLALSGLVNHQKSAGKFGIGLMIG